MSELYINWEVKFKRLYPFVGPIDINIYNEYINCYMYFNRRIPKSHYFPFNHSIGTKNFKVTVSLY